MPISRREIVKADVFPGAARGRLPDAAMRQIIVRYFDTIADR